MVDSINIWYPFWDSSDGSLEKLSSSLKDWSKIEKGNDFVSYRGRLDNLQVSISGRGIRVVGSVPKFLFGNNLFEIQQGDVKLFAEKLNDALGIDMRKGKLTRLDFGNNLICKYPPSMYLEHFADARYFTKKKYTSGISYLNKNRHFALYDKIVEAKKGGQFIPAPFEHKNVLRSEARLMNSASILKYMKKELYLENLADDTVWEYMPKVYQSFYFHINRKKEMGYDLSQITQPKDYYDLLMIQAIQSKGGLEAALKEIDNLKKQNSFSDKRCYARAKKKIRTLYEIGTDLSDKSILEELDAKVKAAFQKSG